MNEVASSDGFSSRHVSQLSTYAPLQQQTEVLRCRVSALHWCLQRNIAENTSKAS